jgi:hypothetical protein
LQEFILLIMTQSEEPSPTEFTIVLPLPFL